MYIIYIIEVYLYNICIYIRLWNTKLVLDNNNAAVVGMVDQCGHQFTEDFYDTYNMTHPIIKKIFKGIHVESIHCYPNAGVMLMNQTLFNELDLLNKIEKLIAINQNEFLYKLGSQPLIVLTWYIYSI